MNIQWKNGKELTCHSARRYGGEGIRLHSPTLGVASRYVGLKAKLQLCNKNKQSKMELI